MSESRDRCACCRSRPRARYRGFLCAACYRGGCDAYGSPCLARRRRAGRDKGRAARAAYRRDRRY